MPPSAGAGRSANRSVPLKARSGASYGRLSGASGAQAAGWRMAIARIRGLLRAQVKPPGAVRSAFLVSVGSTVCHHQPDRLDTSVRKPDCHPTASLILASRHRSLFRGCGHLDHEILLEQASDHRISRCCWKLRREFKLPIGALRGCAEHFLGRFGRCHWDLLVRLPTVGRLLPSRALPVLRSGRRCSARRWLLITVRHPQQE